MIEFDTSDVTLKRKKNSLSTVASATWSDAKNISREKNATGLEQRANFTSKDGEPTFSASVS